MNSRHFHASGNPSLQNHSSETAQLTAKNDSRELTTTSSHPKAGKLALTVASLGLSALNDAYPFVTGLSDIGSNKVLGFIPNTPAAQYIFIATYCGQSIIYNYKYSYEGVEKICDFFKSNASNSWTTLSKKRKIMAGMSSAFLNGFAFILDTNSAAYFFKQQWPAIPSWIVGGLSVTSNIPTEIQESFFSTCEQFNGVQPVIDSVSWKCSELSLKNAGDFSLWAVKSLIKSASAIEDGFEAYIYMTAMLSVSVPFWQWGILILSLANVYNDFRFTGQNTDTVITKAVECLTNLFKQPPTARDVALLLSAVMSAAIVGDVKRNLVLALLNDPDAPFPFPTPAGLKLALSLGAAIPTFLNFASTSYQLLNKGADLATNYVRRDQYTPEAINKFAYVGNDLEIGIPCEINLETVQLTDDVVVKSESENAADDFIAINVVKTSMKEKDFIAIDPVKKATANDDTSIRTDNSEETVSTSSRSNTPSSVNDEEDDEDYFGESSKKYVSFQETEKTPRALSTDLEEKEPSLCNRDDDFVLLEIDEEKPILTASAPQPVATPAKKTFNPLTAVTGLCNKFGLFHPDYTIKIAPPSKPAHKEHRRAASPSSH